MSQSTPQQSTPQQSTLQQSTPQQSTAPPSTPPKARAEAAVAPGRRVASAPGLAGEAEWRREVGEFRSGERRRAFPLCVYVGVPSGERRTAVVGWPVPQEYDAGLRFDVLAALLESWHDGRRAGYVWLSRVGAPELHDEDTLWHAASRRAFGAYDVELLAFRVVTRNGWLDVATGERKVWRRLRL